EGGQVGLVRVDLGGGGLGEGRVLHLGRDLAAAGDLGGGGRSPGPGVVELGRRGGGGRRRGGGRGRPRRGIVVAGQPQPAGHGGHNQDQPQPAVGDQRPGPPAPLA